MLLQKTSHRAEDALFVRGVEPEQALEPFFRGPRLLLVGGRVLVANARVRIETVLLERTTTLLNCRDLDIDEERQFQMHRIRKAELV